MWSAKNNSPNSRELLVANVQRYCSNRSKTHQLYHPQLLDLAVGSRSQDRASVMHHWKHGLFKKQPHFSIDNPPVLAMKGPGMPSLWAAAF